MNYMKRNKELYNIMYERFLNGINIKKRIKISIDC